MPRVASLPAWSAPITLAKGESIQCLVGRVRIEVLPDVGTVPDADDGHELEAGQAYELPAGVIWRHKSSGGGHAAINRLTLEP